MRSLSCVNVKNFIVFFLIVVWRSLRARHTFIKATPQNFATRIFWPTCNLLSRSAPGVYTFQICNSCVVSYPSPLYRCKVINKRVIYQCNDEFLFAYNQIYHSVIISSYCGNLLELSKGNCLFTKMRQIYQSVMTNSCVILAH